MSSPAPPLSAARARFGWLEATLCALVVATLALELRLLFTLNVNWDEFHFLSRIYELRRDALPQRLQTFHVHLFGWLSQVASHEMDQIFAARTALFALGLGSRAFVYAIARRFLGVPAALTALLAYCSFSYVLHHGASFRFDPMLSFLTLLATWLLLGGNGGLVRPALAGLALALSSMISLKTAFQAPVVGVVLLLAGVSARVRRASILAASFVVGFAALYAVHAALVSAPAGGDAGAFLGRIATSFLVSELFPRAEYLTQSFRWDLPVWLLGLAGLAVVCARVLHGADAVARRQAGLLLAFALPLLSLVAYRNAFPYFYPFILAPAVVLCGVPVDAWRNRFRGRAALRDGAVLVAALLVFSGALRFGWAHRKDETLAQRELIELVHELFPVATPYIDRCAMIATYPKAGMFLSKWGLADYREAGRPVFDALIRSQRPQFVIANVPALKVEPALVARTPPAERLLEPDRRVLRDNYLWHWSSLMVAGKTFELARGEDARSFEILIPGPYTVEAAGAVWVDEVLRAPRSVVTLGEGVHTIAPQAGPARVRLRFGDNLRRPRRRPVGQPIFTGFRYR